MNLSFTVYGTPQPQGSSRAFYVKKLGRAVITSDNKRNKPWRQELSQTAMVAMEDSGNIMLPRDRAVIVTARFYFARPKSTPKKIANKTTKPDIDKLARSVLDGLT